jgi:hypothetical protein
LSEQSYELPQSSSRKDPSALKLTAAALVALGGNTKAKDFDNLPSMRSDSQASSSKERGFNQVQKLKFARDND